FDYALIKLPDNKYSIVMPYFSGACSSTFIVEDKSKKRFLLKVPHPNLKNRASDLQQVMTERDLEQMIENEWRIVSSMQEHEGIIKEYGEIPVKLNGKDSKGIVMELVKGGRSFRSLFSWWGDSYHRPINRKDFINLVSNSIKIIDALKHTNEKGIIHKDLWVKNILLDLEGVVKIIDFGLSENVSSYSRIMGKDSSIPPPSIDIQKYDLWSFATILYYMLTGVEDIFQKKQSISEKGFHRLDFTRPIDYSQVNPYFRSLLENIFERINEINHLDIKDALGFLENKIRHDSYFDTENRSLIWSVEDGGREMGLFDSGVFVGIYLGNKLIGCVYKDDFMKSLKEFKINGHSNIDLYLKGRLKVLIQDSGNQLYHMTDPSVIDAHYRKNESVRDFSELDIESLQEYDILITNMPPQLREDMNYNSYLEPAIRIYSDSIDIISKINKVNPLLEVKMYTSARVGSYNHLSLLLHRSGVNTIVDKTDNTKEDLDKLLAKQPFLWSLQRSAQMTLLDKGGRGYICLKNLEGQIMFETTTHLEPYDMEVKDNIRLLV
ncbi:MAG: protein kinase, partial [Nanoarchaeota archaeon]|nr:protein kinase [Nanoarchaeota archaeon]